MQGKVAFRKSCSDMGMNQHHSATGLLNTHRLHCGTLWNSNLSLFSLSMINCSNVSVAQRKKRVGKSFLPFCFSEGDEEDEERSQLQQHAASSQTEHRSRRSLSWLLLLLLFVVRQQQAAAAASNWLYTLLFSWFFSSSGPKSLSWCKEPPIKTNPLMTITPHPAWLGGYLLWLLSV